MTLAYYETKAKRMTVNELRYAIRDIQDTLAIWHSATDYTNKLWVEFDAYTVELHRRDK